MVFFVRIFFICLAYSLQINLASRSFRLNDYRGAVVLTMAGKGAPKYLGWCCLSIEASKNLFDMLIFHEDNDVIESLPCASNVKKINVKRGGLAKLIAKAVAKPYVNSDKHILPKESQLAAVISAVLDYIPFFLAQFKIGTGAIFEEYLREYTHWTYSDPDIIWGNLDEWLSPQELHEYDLITFGKLNDAARLFLRGQFSLHKNVPQLNWRWSSLDYMSIDNVLDFMSTVMQSINKGVPKSVIKRVLFESAEGAYSQHMFAIPEVTVLIAGRMFSDKSLHPVVWSHSVVSRCICHHIKSCILHTLKGEADRNYCASMDVLDNARMIRPPMSINQPEEVGSFDCGMNWLKLPYRKCLTPSHHHERIMNEAVLLGGKWYVNNEEMSLRLRVDSGAMFHFRVWEDELSSEIVSHPVKKRTTCFITYLALQESKLYIHECNEDLVSNSSNAILDMSSSKQVILGILKSHRKKARSDRQIAKNLVDI